MVWWLLYAVDCWMGTCKVGILGGYQLIWWSRSHELHWWICLRSQWNLFIQWSQHLHGRTYRSRCSQPYSCSLETFRYALEWKTQLCSLRDETRTQGKEKGNTEGEQDERLWGEHLARLERLAWPMVDPPLHRPEHGDASECILL